MSDAHSAQGGLPLVSIAIPTYNRVDLLRRCVESARSQTYPHLEILIADNASPDDTSDYCEEAAALDPRIRYIRRPENVGPTANFNLAREATTGAYFMWLADDDWLDETYIERCLDELRRHPTLGLVAGVERYFDGDRFSHDVPPVTADAPSTIDRVLSYYRQVSDNGVFYGLMPRAVIDATTPPGDRIGGDWLFLAEVAFLGGIRTIESTAIQRSIAPDRTFLDLARSAHLTRFEGHFPYIAIAWFVAYDIAWRSQVFAPLGWRRPLLGARASAVIFRRFIITGLRWSSLKRRGRNTRRYLSEHRPRRRGTT